MQVMDTREFEQDHVLVGQKGKVGKATVTNDPILMSMLSTGLYANPLKSMVQEVTFNAWDAHRMGNCLDKPIDIYFNDTTGLIIRDYGPGIAPGETFTNVYFTYGGSTKREDDEATGGFGLGSKSPFAYNDTFNVTSHHNGQKYMYIMHRVHEDNDGGPGHTPIIEGAPTTESGLMVSVGFKSSSDKIRAYEYLKEILYLSGIKAVIHFEGDSDGDTIPATELVVSDSLEPTEFINRESNPHGGLYAVYGGVSYEIPDRGEYTNDYDFLRKIANMLGDIYIGFAPNTLTPLPTREGLNMGERSLESITAALETIQEHFMELMLPATKTLMLECLTETKTLGIQSHLVRRKWSKIGIEVNLYEMVPQEGAIERAQARRNENQNKASWNSLTRLAFKNTRMIAQMIGRGKIQNIAALVWCKVYPEHRNWRHSISGVKKEDVNLMLTATQGVQRQWNQDTIQLWKDLCDLTDQTLELRTHKGHYNSKWETMTNIRAAGGYNHISHSRKLNIIKRLDKENKLKVPTEPSIDGLWYKKDGAVFHGPMMNKTIIVAKTLTALNKTEFDYMIQDAVVPGEIKRHSFHQMNWGTWVGAGSTLPVAAFVIHRKKDGYDNAVQYLKDQGYTVLEADEPEVRERPAPKAALDDGEVLPEPAKPKGFPKVSISNNYETWESYEYVQKPTTYVYVTKAQIASYGDYPDKDLVRMVQVFCPNMVIVHNKRVAEKLDKAGVLSIWERLDKLVEDILKDKERLKIMYMHYFLQEQSDFPDSLLENTQMQKLMGVPYIRTKQKDKFFRDLKLLRYVAMKNRYRDGRGVPHDLQQKVEKALKDVRRDDSLVLVRKMNRASKMFNESQLDAYISGMKPGERKCFIEKLARFMRTV